MIVNISLSSDNNYAPFLSVAIYSLLKNSDQNNNYFIYILDGGISQNNKNLIEKSLINYKNKKIKYIQIDQKIFIKMIPFLQINQTSFYRLLLPEILPDINKVIYLDCDILVLKDLTKLYQFELNNNLIGACQIFHPNYRRVLQKVYPNLKIVNTINAGITLMDLNKLRKENCTKKFIDYVNKHSNKLIAGDQDILNVVLLNNIKLIPPTWNCSSYLFIAKNNHKCGLNKNTFINCVKNPSIVHFDGIKPWASGSNHPYKKLFFEYLSYTAFKNYKFRFNLKQFIKNEIFYLGNMIANFLPNRIYDIVEKQYLKNNFLEKKYRDIIKV